MPEKNLTTISPQLKPQTRDLTGLRFGRLIVVEFAGRHPKSCKALWQCLCDCGTRCIIRNDHLTGGRIASCGCWRREFSSQLNRTHGMTGIPEHRVWRAMIQRCCNPNSAFYKNYGGRGINVCKQWKESFAAFYQDLGPKPFPSHTLERVDNSQGYEPGNTIWATKIQNARNTRKNVYLVYKGQRDCIAAWSERTGISSTAIRHRLERGWSVEKTLSVRSGESRTAKKITYHGQVLTIQEWAERTGIPKPLIKDRLRQGWAIERALTQEIRHIRKHTPN